MDCGKIFDILAVKSQTLYKVGIKEDTDATKGGVTLSNNANLLKAKQNMPTVSPSLNVLGPAPPTTLNAAAIAPITSTNSVKKNATIESPPTPSANMRVNTPNTPSNIPSNIPSNTPSNKPANVPVSTTGKRPEFLNRNSKGLVPFGAKIPEPTGKESNRMKRAQVRAEAAEKRVLEQEGGRSRTYKNMNKYRNKRRTLRR